MAARAVPVVRSPDREQQEQAVAVAEAIFYRKAFQVPMAVTQWALVVAVVQAVAPSLERRMFWAMEGMVPVAVSRFGF
jgi:hypothetical protein